MRNGITYTYKNGLEYLDLEMELVFIKIESTVFGAKSDFSICGIYRIPDSSVHVFNERVCDLRIVVTKEKKICYLVGDLNMNFLKHEEHRLTSDFVDILYGNNMFPLLVRPAKVNDNSATLIDHIITNNCYVYSRHKQTFFTIVNI